jgi:mannose-6-phosphate isomerase-like protein (cupin superfamily)
MKRVIVNPVIKDKAVFIRTASESEGKVTEIEISVAPGGGNALHYHKTYSETFIANEGVVGLKLGKNITKMLQPGESYTVPPMALHSFFNPGKEEIKFTVLIEPGHAGFENSLRIIYGMAEDGLTNDKSIPKKLSDTALLIEMSDMNGPGLFTLMYPLLKMIAKTARKRGDEQRLIERYCM